MWSIAWTNLRANPVRFVSTVLAVVLATTFLAGALVLRDSIARTIEVSAETGLRQVAVAVTPPSLSLGAPGGGLGQRQQLPEDLLTTIRGVDGVGVADGTLTAKLDLLGDDGRPVVKDLTGNRLLTGPLLSFAAAEGRLPSQAGEVAVDRETADRRGLHVGQHLDVATAVGARSATLVGISTYLDRDRASTTGDLLVTPDDAFEWLGGGDRAFSTILVTAAPGVGEQQLTDRVRAVVGDGADVMTGTAYREQLTGAGRAVADLLGTGLQIFAYVALGVGGFIIYNTFTIVVTQRLREFALLRAVGATGAQVRRMVRAEALSIGVGASALGIAAGAAVVAAGARLVPGLSQLAGGGSLLLTLQPSAALQVLLSGVVITYLSATLPAWRASRTRPVEAMALAAIDRSGRSRRRGVVGLATLGVGAALLLLGTALSHGLLLAFGPPLLFLGVLIAGPVLAESFARLAHAPFDPHRQPIAALATANAARNPNRTATTANALVIGVFLVVFVTSAGGALRDWTVAQLASLGTVDAIVSTDAGKMPAELVDGIRALPEAQDVAELVSIAGVATVQGSPVPVEAAADPTELFRVRDQQPTSGSFDDLPPDGIVLPDLFAQGSKLALGDAVDVRFTNGQQRTFRLAATTPFALESVAPVVRLDTARAADAALDVDTVQVRAVPGQSDALVRALEDLTLPYATVTVTPGGIFGTVVRDLFNGLISSVNALLAVAVVIALFGVVNTLVLSVTERTHEIGVLRAVGMSRRQLRRAVRIEAVLVSLLGTTLGIAFGLLVGWCLTRPLLQNQAGEGLATGTIAFSWPVVELVAIAVLGLVLGVAAAIVPAWRATRLDVLDAIRTE